MAARKVCCVFLLCVYLVNFNCLIDVLSFCQPSWVTDEEFGMGYLELKTAAPLASKPSASNLAASQNNSIYLSQNEPGGGKTTTLPIPNSDSGNMAKDHSLRSRTSDVRTDKIDGLSVPKSELGHGKLKGTSLNGPDSQPLVPSTSVNSGSLRMVESQKPGDDLSRTLDEGSSKVVPKSSSESEVVLNYSFSGYLIVCVYVSVEL